MSQSDATRFVEMVREDRAIVEWVIGLPAPTELNKNDLVKIGADLGLQFNLEELHNAVGAYLMQHAAQLNPADIEYLEAAGVC